MPERRSLNKCIMYRGRVQPLIGAPITVNRVCTKQLLEFWALEDWRGGDAGGNGAERLRHAGGEQALSREPLEAQAALFEFNVREIGGQSDWRDEQLARGDRSAFGVEGREEFARSLESLVIISDQTNDDEVGGAGNATQAQQHERGLKCLPLFGDCGHLCAQSGFRGSTIVDRSRGGGSARTSDWEVW